VPSRLEITHSVFFESALAIFSRNGEPSHCYTMRQAIEEGFIMVVLTHYVSYKTYYRLIKACEDNPNVERKKAARALT